MEKNGFFTKLKGGLSRTREALSKNLDALLFGEKILDAHLFEQLEELLIGADLGPRFTRELLDEVQDKIKRRELNNVQEVKKILRDRMLAICSAVLKKEGQLKNNFVVRTVMSNLGLSVAFQELGIDSVFAPVGDRFVLEEMLARGAIIGGEDSGHLIFLKHHTTGDGLITALQVLAAMKKEDKPLSKLAGIMKVFPQMLINIDGRKKPKIETIPEITAAIKQAEKELDDKGRVLVRYSGTQNMCRVMVEGPTDEVTAKYCQQIVDAVKALLRDKTVDPDACLRADVDPAMTTMLRLHLAGRYRAKGDCAWWLVAGPRANFAARNWPVSTAWTGHRPRDRSRYYALVRRDEH